VNEIQKTAIVCWEGVGTECTLVHCSLYTRCIYRVLTPRELKNQVVNLQNIAIEGSETSKHARDQNIFTLNEAASQPSITPITPETSHADAAWHTFDKFQNRGTSSHSCLDQVQTDLHLCTQASSTCREHQEIQIEPRSGHGGWLGNSCDVPLRLLLSGF
jgi:hypothetical protein